MKSSRSGRDLFRVNAVTAGCLVALLAAGAAVLLFARRRRPV